MSVILDFFRDIGFDRLIHALYDGGWFTIIFPFLLVYAIVFTILTKAKIQALDNKPTIIIIALVFSLFAVTFPITGNPGAFCVTSNSIVNPCGSTLGYLMASLFPGVSAFAIVILSLYIVAAMLGFRLLDIFGENKTWVQYVLGGIGILVVLYYTLLGFGWSGFESVGGNWFLSILTDPLLYILLVFGLLFFWISYGEGSNTP